MGLTAGLVILVKAVTGMVLAYEEQIVDFAERDLQHVSVPSPETPRLSPAALVEKAQAAVTKGKFSGLTIKSDPTTSAMVNFGREGGAYYVNPYTGDVLGKESKTHDFMHAVDDFHRWFGFREKGRPVSGAATLIFFFISLSGIYLWWPSTWSTSKLKSITVFNGRLSGKARDFNWHNVAGFWCMPVLALIAATGVIMSYQWANDLLYRATGNEPPPAAAPQRPMGGDKAKSAEPELPGSVYDVNALFATAEKQVSGWKSIALRLPQKPGGPVNAFILEEEYKVGIPKRSQLTLDAATAEIKKWEPFSETNSGRKARTWARYLHSGEAGGLIGQTIAFIAAGAAVLLTWTGFALSWRRFFRS